MQLTVAVCTYRRYDWLLKCLKSLELQSLSKEALKVIVVDNSLLPQKAEEFRGKQIVDLNIEYIITEKAGLSYARNIALEKCETPYIAYIDDDALAKPDWAENILRCFKRYCGAAGIVGGRVRPIWEIPKPDWLRGSLFNPLAVLDFGDKEFVIERTSGKWIVGANLCYDVAALRKEGGFSEHLGRKKNLLLCHEELSVNNAIRDMGYLMVYCSDAIVDHLVQKERISLRWLCRDAFWEAVSYSIYISKKANDCALTPPMRKELNITLERLFQSFEPKSNQEDAEKECNRFRKAGHTAMAEYGFVPKTLSSVPSCVYIVTPCLNAKEYIDQCIESVISQAGDFYIRYHIQDGGSVDGTLEKLTAWKEKLDFGQHTLFCKGVTFTFASSPDDGIYDGISRGFKFMDPPAKAAMTWINSDDYLIPGALATVQKAFSVFQDIHWVIGPVHVCTEKSYPFGCHRIGFPLALIQAGICDSHHWQTIQQEGTFWRKWLWDKVGGLDLSCKYAGDWDLWRRFAMHCRPVQTDWPLGCFRSHRNQLTAKHMDHYHAEVESRVPFSQRQNAINHLIKNKEDNWIHLLVGTSDKSYQIKRHYLSSENIPGCTWQNCPDIVKILLGQALPRDKEKVDQTQKPVLSETQAIRTGLQQDMSFTESQLEKAPWNLSPVPGQRNTFFSTGWHSQESDSSGWWCWCSGQGIIHIKTLKSQKSSLFLTLTSGLEEEEISINLNGQAIFSRPMGLKAQEIGPVALQLRVGTNIVLIHPKQNISSPDDSMFRRFTVKNIKIEGLKNGGPSSKDRVALFRPVRWIRQSRLFLEAYYLRQLPILKEKNGCSEIHYLLYGAWENYNPNPLFDSTWYLSQNKDVYLSGKNPLLHYLLYGWKEGRDPHPEFSTKRYLIDYKDVRDSGMNPLSHYLSYGIFEDKTIHPST